MELTKDWGYTMTIDICRKERVRYRDNMKVAQNVYYSGQTFNIKIAQICHLTSSHTNVLLLASVLPDKGICNTTQILKVRATNT